MKRLAETELSADNSTGMQPAKAPRTGSAEVEPWTCQSSLNVNCDDRAFCNMQKCGLPQPQPQSQPQSTGPASWSCPGCGNENRPGRLFCNIRTCGLAKPGLTQRDFDSVMAPLPPNGGLNTHFQVPFQSHAQATQVCMPIVTPPQQMPQSVPPPSIRGPVPPGSWMCTTCNNVNFPDRAVCNGRRGMCGLPRPTADVLQALQAAPQPMRAAVGGSPPLGSWVCLACGNVNFPSRVVCNSRTCGKPREQVDGGAPGVPPPQGNFGTLSPYGMTQPEYGVDGIDYRAQMAAFAQHTAPVHMGQSLDNTGLMAAPPQMASTPPAGSWVCPSCQNVNYPSRTHCNRRHCNLPRPADV